MYPHDPFRDELERAQRIRDAMDPPYMRHLREQQAVREAAELVTRHQEMAEQRRVLADRLYSDSLRQVDDMLRRQSEALAVFETRRLDELARHARDVFDRHTAFEDAARQSAMTAIQAAEQRLAVLYDPIRLAMMSGAAVQQALLDLEDANTDQSREEVLTRLVDAVRAWAEKLPPSAVTVVIVRRVVTFVWMCVIPQALALEACAGGARRQWVLEEKLEELSALVARTVPTEAPRMLHVTQRPLPLRVAPHGEAVKTSTVPACTLVEELDQQGKWLRVLYIDNDTGTAVTGWLFGRHVQDASDLTECQPTD